MDDIVVVNSVLKYELTEDIAEVNSVLKYELVEEIVDNNSPFKSLSLLSKSTLIYFLNATNSFVADTKFAKSIVSPY